MSVESTGGRAPRGQGPAVVARLTRLIEPLVAAEGFDLEGLDVRPAGKRRLVKVVVDADGGVSLDDVATVNQAVSAALDESDVMGDSPYVLEVTSPGVDRPLTEPRHWRRAVGRLVRVPVTGGGEVEGRVVSAGDAEVIMDIVTKPGKKGAQRVQRRSIGFGELGSGKVQVEFRPSHGDAEDDLVDRSANEAGN